MAKSAENGKGSKSRNLELDFLRLIYAVEHYRSSGDQAMGYLLVFNQQLRQTIIGWVRKYDAEGAVEIVVAQLSEEQGRLYLEEKDRNRLGNTTAADRSLAMASYSRDLGEQALRDHIQTVEIGVTELELSDAPFEVLWDFFGSADEIATIGE
jgi:hypothetical protein